MTACQHCCTPPSFHLLWFGVEDAVEQQQHQQLMKPPSPPRAQLTHLGDAYWRLPTASGALFMPGHACIVQCVPEQLSHFGGC